MPYFLPRLLIRSAIGHTESLRCYVARMAQLNHAQSFFEPFTSSLDVVCDNLGTVSRLTGENIDVLQARIGMTRCRRTQRRICQIGVSTLSAKMIARTTRSLCLRCIRQGADHPIYWELLCYDVCHLHRCKLLTHCSTCANGFDWRTVLGYTCPCAKSSPVPRPSRKLQARAAVCGKIAQSCLRALELHNQGRSTAGMHAQASGFSMSLDTLLICIQFINQLLLPKYFAVSIDFKHDKGLDIADAILESLLSDEEYMRYLRERLFMRAADDPMKLADYFFAGLRNDLFEKMYEPCLRGLWIPRRLFGFVNALPRATHRRDK